MCSDASVSVETLKKLPHNEIILDDLHCEKKIDEKKILLAILYRYLVALWTNLKFQKTYLWTGENKWKVIRTSSELKPRTPVKSVYISKQIAIPHI